jgi:hypothetical protein
MHSPLRLICHDLPDLLRGVGIELRVASVSQRHLYHTPDYLHVASRVHACLQHVKRCATGRGVTCADMHWCQQPTSPES